MTAAQTLNEFIAVVEKHFNQVKAERKILFPTAKEHSAMIQEAKRRAIYEYKG